MTQTTESKTGIFAGPKPKSKTAKTKRAKGTWDVDDAKAKRIYGAFTRYDRAESAFGDGWWSRFEGSNVDPAQVKRLKNAATMVQTFVDALSGEQSNYVVSLTAHATTASTDLAHRVMKLPAKTILDPDLTDEEASLLMVAFLGHEIGHVRIDDTIDKALQDDATIVERGLYNSLSTILREARVEAGFSDLFPGYSGLFEPLLRWISRGTKDGSPPPKDALGFAVAATRYPFRFNWSKPEHAVERDWWVKWVEVNGRKDDYPSHKAALDEAYAHIQSTLNPPKPDAQPQDGQDGEQAQSGMPGESQDDPATGEGSAEGDGEGQSQSSTSTGQSTGQQGGGSSQGDGNEAKTPYESVSGTNTSDYQLAQEKADIETQQWSKVNQLRQDNRDGKIDYEEMWNQIQEVEKAAKAAKTKATREKTASEKAQASIPASIEQVDAGQIGKKKRQNRTQQAEIDNVTRAANEEMGLDYAGQPVRASKVTPSQPRKGMGVVTDPEATSIFRSTFMRLRGGNDARVGGKRSGRLDDRHIYRLADRRDDRVFTRRGAAKTQHLRVYLMVDTSGSMGGAPEQQIRAVAKALIEASIGADNLTLEVWGWDNTVAPVWQRGEDPDEVLRLNARGGTDDTGALRFAVDRMRSALRVEEHGLIIMMSDGAGKGNRALKTQVERARTMGMSVFGITMAQNFDQTEAYGADGFVKWQGSVSKTAQPLSEIIAQSWVTKDQHRA